MTPSQENNSGTCPKCNNPITSGMKFCETCGAKIETPTVCRQCGAPVPPNVKFCESCGKPVAHEAAQKVSAAPLAPAPAAAPVTPVEKPPVVAPAPAEVKTPAPQPEPAAAVIEKIPDKKTPERQKETAQNTSEKVPASNTQTMVIAGVVGLIIIAALAFFVLLPMLSGSGTASSGATPNPTTAVSGTSAQSSTPAQNVASASFVLEPTQVPPAALFVTYQAERDPITGIVTVTFTGGQGSAVRDVLIRLTLADGQVVMKTFKPTQIGSLDSLQGTTNSKGSDRIEVIANYYNGDKYRIIDKLFEYKKKF